MIVWDEKRKLKASRMNFFSLELVVVRDEETKYRNTER